MRPLRGWMRWLCAGTPARRSVRAKSHKKAKKVKKAKKAKNVSRVRSWPNGICIKSDPITVRAAYEINNPEQAKPADRADYGFVTAVETENFSHTCPRPGCARARA